MIMNFLIIEEISVAVTLDQAAVPATISIDELKELLAKEGTATESLESPVREFYTSDEPALFEQVATPFLGAGLPSGTKHFTTDRYEVTV